ncbi:MAG TPA: hypothetical protein VMW27_21400 [Thermoanaerobaculia bacterium]|nr:hypothetical protein [Thermoanaerobaculia bacterium]
MSRRIVRRALAVLALAWALLLWSPAHSEAAGFTGSSWEVGSLWEQALSWFQGLWSQPAETAERPAATEKSIGTPVPTETGSSDVTVSEEYPLHGTRIERGGAMDPNG